jgi:sarcosine oxidase
MPDTYDVAVIGLGAVGAATLYQLARRGAKAIGLDRFSPPHSYGSSHGETRITREAVGEGKAYVPLVRRSHEIWRELEGATGKRLLVECGCLIIGRPDATTRHHHKPSFLKATIGLAREFGIKHEEFDASIIAKRFPQFDAVPEDEVGYFEPGAGFLRPEECIKVQLSEATRIGRGKLALKTNTRVSRITQDGNTVRVDTVEGPIEASRAVVSAGAWTANLLGTPYDDVLTVTCQILYWFKPDDPALYAEPRCPAFIRIWGAGDEEYFYGLPTPTDSVGVKIATEDLSARIDPDKIDCVTTNKDGMDFFNRHLNGRMHGLRGPAIKTVSCLYTNTPDSNFIIDVHPKMPNVLVVSACSGHGFKHSAAIGELAANGDTNSPLLQPFRLRSPDRSLTRSSLGELPQTCIRRTRAQSPGPSCSA